MAARIRLRRMGTTKRPAYRVVVADGRTPRDGRFVEAIGYYNPLTDPPVIRIDTEKATAWLKKGALPSNTVRQLLARAGVRAG
ncbi:MAG: 30S ribosomal protein S16 [Candidatus Rokuibacteriota bacterium]